MISPKAVLRVTKKQAVQDGIDRFRYFCGRNAGLEQTDLSEFSSLELNPLRVGFHRPQAGDRVNERRKV